MRVRHIAYVVRDLERSAQFYEDVLQFRRVGPRTPGNFPGPAMDMSDGEVNVSLLQPSDGVTDSWNSKSLGPIHLGIVVDDIQRVEEALGAHGIAAYAHKGEPLSFLKFRDPDDVEFDVSSSVEAFPL